MALPAVPFTIAAKVSADEFAAGRLKSRCDAALGRPVSSAGFCRRLVRGAGLLLVAWALVYRCLDQGGGYPFQDVEGLAAALPDSWIQSSSGTRYQLTAA